MTDSDDLSYLAARDEIFALMREIRRTRLSAFSPGLAALVTQTWGLRWRIAADSMGQNRARGDRFMRLGYALIRESQEQYPDGLPHIPALNPAATGTWLEDLAKAKSDLSYQLELKQQRDEASASACALFDELRAIPSRYHLPEDPGGVLALREAVRSIAAFLPLREDLAQFCLPYRSLLESEFPFLWRSRELRADARSRPPRHLTNRAIAARILRRMLSNSLIGASHGPIDRVTRGFPAHDLGRAKEALDRMVTAGVIRSKPTSIGYRVSITPTLVPAVHRFISGHSLGIPSIDRWFVNDATDEAA